MGWASCLKRIAFKIFLLNDTHLDPAMNVVKEIQRLNAREAQLSTSHSLSGSWHDQYKESAHVFVGGLPFHLTEGDILCVLSQFGELAGINLVRDKDTGKSRGFAFLKYVDQRSTILAVDNMNGAQIGGRTIRVDHVQNYKVPKVFDEDGNELEPDEETVNNAAPKLITQESDDDDDSSDESGVDDTGIDIDDPMREYLLNKRRKDAQKAKRKAEKKEGKKSSASKAERKAKKEQKRAAKKLKEEGGKDQDTDIKVKKEETQEPAIKKEELDVAPKQIKEEGQSANSPALSTVDKMEDVKIKREVDDSKTQPLASDRSERSRDGREDRSSRRYDSRRSRSRSPPRRSYRDRSRSRSPSYRDRRRGGRDGSADRRDRGYSGRDSYNGSGSRRRRSPSPPYRSSRKSRSRSPPPRPRGEYSRRSPSPRRRRSSRSPSPRP